MAGVVIEQLDWRDLLRRYDREGMLFYLDPPYFGNEGDYGTGVFSRADFADMAERLADLKGRFILSINDRPEVRQIFKAFAQEQVDCSYSIKGGVGKAVKELIISGPDGRASR